MATPSDRALDGFIAVRPTDRRFTLSVPRQSDRPSAFVVRAP